MNKIKRVIIIVFDSLGIGELPDAAQFNDVGSNTLANTANVVDGLNLPNLAKLGLGNIIPVKGVSFQKTPIGCYGKMAELANGKDTTVGHWELMGVIKKEPFPVYPHGFPSDIINTFSQKIGRPILGNKPASGTEIIAELGEEHLKTGFPIVYTSADSVFQIAAHQDIVPLKTLYSWCEIARQILTGKHAVARVIARPFMGKPGNFKRTHWRRDFSLPPPTKTVLDYATEQGVKVLAAGKISEIFAGRGISESVHTKSNNDTFNQLFHYILTTSKKDTECEQTKSIIFANLVDFDTLWGHRNDPRGYAQGLEEADKQLSKVLELLTLSDLLIITADHGCDPTTPSTDHSREYVPVIAYGLALNKGVNLGLRKTFADVGKTVAEALNLKIEKMPGESFWPLVSDTLCAGQ